MSLLFFFVPWVVLILAAVIDLAVAAMREKKNRPTPESYDSGEGEGEDSAEQGMEAMPAEPVLAEGDVQPIGDDFGEFDQQFG